jgi:hypothetical protein
MRKRTYKLLIGNLKRKEHFENLDVDVRIILKCRPILKKEGEDID